MARTRHPKRRAVLLAILGTVLLACTVGLMTLMLGRVSGREFAASHMTTRSFHFWEIPLIHLQVSPIYRSPDTNAVTNYLRSQNIIQVPQGPPTQWQLVEIQRGVSRPTPADPKILTDYLELGESPGTPVWESWSRDHAAAAAVLWPAVKRLAEKDLYILIPELFALAEQHTDATRLATEIDAYLPAAYTSLAKDLVAAGQETLAKAVVTDGLADYPDHPPLRTLSDQLTDPHPS